MSHVYKGPSTKPKHRAPPPLVPAALERHLLVLAICFCRRAVLARRKNDNAGLVAGHASDLELAHVCVLVYEVDMHR